MYQLDFQSFAATYNCGAYGAGSFDEGTTCAGTTTTQSGNLVDTGANVYVPLIGGIVLIAIAVALIVTRFVRRKKA